jgi:hypothetical protein
MNFSRVWNLVQQLYGVDVDMYSNFILDILFEEDERFQQQAAFISIAVDPTTSSSSQDLDAATSLDPSSFAALWSYTYFFCDVGVGTSSPCTAPSSPASTLPPSTSTSSTSPCSSMSSANVAFRRFHRRLAAVVTAAILHILAVQP